MKNIILSVVLIFSFISCANNTNINKSVVSKDNNAKYFKMYIEGFKVLQAGKNKKAIEDYFNPIINYYTNFYSNKEYNVYNSRTTTETLYYLALSVSKNGNKEAKVFTNTFADAYYYKGYALYNLGNIDLAKKSLKKAIELSPANARYYSELAYFYQTENNWTMSSILFLQAIEFVSSTSPKKYKNIELSRALRGYGFVLIEKNDLNKAEITFKKCLEINKNDNKAKKELKYIKQLRSEQMPNKI